MKAHAVLLFVLLSVTAASLSEAQEVPELTKLREGYKAAVERATKPLAQTYVAELTKLRDALSRAAKPDAVNAVQAEINLIEAESNVKPIGASAAKPTAAGVKLPDVKWFVGKAWATDRGSKWVFSKDGKTGEKKKGDVTTATFTWVMVPETGLVELTERAGTSTGKCYMRFEDRNVAWAGGSTNDMTAKLHPE